MSPCLGVKKLPYKQLVSVFKRIVHGSTVNDSDSCYKSKYYKYNGNRDREYFKPIIEIGGKALLFFRQIFFFGLAARFLFKAAGRKPDEASSLDERVWPLSKPVLRSFRYL